MQPAPIKGSKNSISRLPVCTSADRSDQEEEEMASSRWEASDAELYRGRTHARAFLFGISTVCCRTRAQQLLSFYLICTSVQLSAWLLALVQSPKNIIDASALPTGKFLRIFTKLPIKCSLNINLRVNKCEK